MISFLKLGIKEIKPFFLTLGRIEKIGAFCKISICKNLGLCLNIKTGQLSKIQVNKVHNFIKFTNSVSNQKLVDFKNLFLKTLRKTKVLRFWDIAKTVKQLFLIQLCKGSIPFIPF